MKHVLTMNKHIQIREVPEDTHRALKARAAAEGLSMSDYLKRLIAQDLKRPDWASIQTKMAQMPRIELEETTAEMVRRERDRHGEPARPTKVSGQPSDGAALIDHLRGRGDVAVTTDEIIALTRPSYASE
ncbi:MAG: hypothetical protein ACFB2Z_10150 [Maricaulaceae bacterium]